MMQTLSWSSPIIDQQLKAETDERATGMWDDAQAVQQCLLSISTEALQVGAGPPSATVVFDSETLTSPSSIMAT